MQTSRDAAPATDSLAARLGLPEPGGEEPEAAEPAEPESRGARGARLGMTLVWIVLAVAASVLRMCQERG